MTESQWLACSDPGTMVEILGRSASQRKLRLFACACCRRTAELFPDDRCLTALAVAERFADGAASLKELADAGLWVNELEAAAQRRVGLADAAYGRDRSATSATALALAEAVYSAVVGVTTAVAPTIRVASLGLNSACAVGCHVASVAYRTGATDRVAQDAEDRATQGEQAAQADLLRDLFNDQFRFVVPDHAWFTSDVMAMAGAIYDGRAFDQLPILADALQDAGCDNEDVLNHCRRNAVHVRGCWAVDMVLGKA